MLVLALRLGCLLSVQMRRLLLICVALLVGGVMTVNARMCYRSATTEWESMTPVVCPSGRTTCLILAVDYYGTLGYFMSLSTSSVFYYGRPVE